MGVAKFNMSDQYKGDSFERHDFDFWVTAATSGNEIDMTGYVPKMQMRYDNAAGRLVKTLTIGDGLEWDDEANGKMYLSPFLITFAAGKYVYDIQMTHPDGSVLTYVRGEFNVIDDVTS